jgi:signal transduction histidine kinase
VELTPLILAVAVTYRQVMGMTDPGRGARWDATWRTVLRREANVSAAVSLLVLVIWVLSGGSFWPRWVWFGLAVPLALQAGVRRGLRAPRGQRSLTVHVAVSVVLAFTALAIWVLAGANRTFWPAWPALGLGIALALHGWIRHGLPAERERALIDRVDVLTRTRSGAVDVHAAELRRIERDLHDGAQARMVSVAMNLGLAEALLDKDPQSLAGLLAESRSSMLTALDELRTVMRGIQPPVLADRGLAGAVRALALHLAVPVKVAGELPGQAPPPVESAVYFAVSECLANVVKHSGAQRAEVGLGYRDGVLWVVVSDDGDGGASMTAGTGLRGVAVRLEVFDGTIALTSPAGGPTVVRMEVPCELSSPRT